MAEGAEIEEQSRLLRLLSCDEMQAFLFSKPLPGEIFEKRYLASPPQVTENTGLRLFTSAVANIFHWRIGTPAAGMVFLPSR